MSIWRMPDWHWERPSHCYGEFQWVEEWNGNVPHGAVRAGVDKDGGDIFVGRAWECDDLIPAKVCPAHGCAFVSYGGRQVEKKHYQVLVSNHVAWESARGGYVPPSAIRVGHTTDGEPLYAGRTMHHGTLTVGKVHPSQGCLYIAWSGDELRYEEYEVMVIS